MMPRASNVVGLDVDDAAGDVNEAVRTAVPCEVGADRRHSGARERHDAGVRDQTRCRRSWPHRELRSVRPAGPRPRRPGRPLSIVNAASKPSVPPFCTYRRPVGNTVESPARSSRPSMYSVPLRVSEPTDAVVAVPRFGDVPAGTIAESPGPGTAPVLQFAAMFQRLAPAAVGERATVDRGVDARAERRRRSGGIGRRRGDVRPLHRRSDDRRERGRPADEVTSRDVEGARKYCPSPKPEASHTSLAKSLDAIVVDSRRERARHREVDPVEVERGDDGNREHLIERPRCRVRRCP